MLLALQSPQQDPSPRDFPFSFSLPLPLPPSTAQTPQSAPHFLLPDQPQMTLYPPPSHPRRRPKLSLTIDQTTRRSFSSARANNSAARVPQTAMSPTSRNTLANANLTAVATNLHRGYSSACTPRGCYDEIEQDELESSPSSSSSSSSSDDDEAMASSDTNNPQLSPKEKKRQRRSFKAKHPTLKTCHHSHGSDAFSFLPKPQPSKRGLLPSDRRVRFADEHIVIPREPESESEEEEGGMTMMERMVELEKLRSTVEASDDEKEGAGREVGGWMYKLGKKEYDAICEMEDAAAIPVPTTPTEPSTPSYSNVGFGFGSGI